MSTKSKRAGGGRYLPLRREGRNVWIDSSRVTFGTDCPFASIPWFEGPEEGSTLPRAFHLDRAQKDSKSSCLCSHRGEASFVRICAATQQDRLARLAMEHSIGLSAACQKQYHHEHETSRHIPSPLISRRDHLRNVPLPTCWIEVAMQVGVHF